MIPEPEADGEEAPLLGDQTRTTKHDRLLHYGKKAAKLRSMEEEGGPQHVSLRVLVLASSSAVSFAGTMALVCRYYHKAPVATVFAATQVVAFGVLLSLLWQMQRWHRWLGRFIAAASSAGMSVGLYIYYSQLVYYQHYAETKNFTDVAASQPSVLFADAGVLGFASDVRLDASQSVGYRFAGLGRTLCVAPIVDNLMGASDKISFYAAGVDCCAWRSRFQCGDARDPDVQGGLLQLTSRQLVSPLMEWAIQEDVELMEGFSRAVKLQTAVFGSVASESPRFLRWSRDPQALVDNYLRRAVHMSIGSFCAFCCAALVAALLAALGRLRLSVLLDEFTEAWEGRRRKVPPLKAPWPGWHGL